jgi:hypothetical protein
VLALGGRDLRRGPGEPALHAGCLAPRPAYGRIVFIVFEPLEHPRGAELALPRPARRQALDGRNGAFTVGEACSISGSLTTP